MPLENQQPSSLEIRTKALEVISQNLGPYTSALKILGGLYAAGLDFIEVPARTKKQEEQP